VQSSERGRRGVRIQQVELVEDKRINAQGNSINGISRLKDYDISVTTQFQLMFLHASLVILPRYKTKQAVRLDTTTVLGSGIEKQNPATNS
jgi:hypothetical protein